MTGGEGVDEGFLLVDRAAKPTGDEVGQAHADRIALRALGQRQGSDDVDYGAGEVFAVAHLSVANDIGVMPMPL